MVTAGDSQDALTERTNSGVLQLVHTYQISASAFATVFLRRLRLHRVFYSLSFLSSDLADFSHALALLTKH